MPKIKQLSISARILPRFQHHYLHFLLLAISIPEFKVKDDVKEAPHALL